MKNLFARSRVLLGERNVRGHKVPILTISCPVLTRPPGPI